MSRIKLGLTFCLFIAAAFAIAYGYKQEASSSMQLCKHQYALCTSAPCIPQPDDLTKAICFCDVEEGASMSSAPCNTIQPSTDANGIRTVYSAFSLEQFKQGKKVLTCPSGTPWTWCLNKRCTVDPLNPKKAICTCDVLRTQEWITLGGNCDTATCTTGYWSGATPKDFNEASVLWSRHLASTSLPLNGAKPPSHKTDSRRGSDLGMLALAGLVVRANAFRYTFNEAIIGDSFDFRLALMQIAKELFRTSEL